MTKRILFDRIRHILDEVFDDVSDEKFEFSVLGDLFQDSHLRLQDSFMKLHVFNSLPLPLKLKIAYIGQIQIEGFLGVMTSGSTLRCKISDSLFVFGAKEIELHDEMTRRFAQEIAIAILHRLWNKYHIEGKGPQKNESTKTWIKKRMTAAIHNMEIRIENTQFRIEMEHEETTSVWGVIIPRIAVFTAELSDCILNRRELPLQFPKLVRGMAKAITIDGMQLYTTRIPTTSWSPLQWRSHFLKGWPGEVHVDVVVPTDIKVKVDVEDLDGKLKVRAMDMTISELNCSIDPLQIQSLGLILTHLDRFQKYSKYQIFRPSRLDKEAIDPRPLVFRSFTVFPQLEPIEKRNDPKSRFQPRSMWKYAVTCIINDLYCGRRNQDHFIHGKLIIDYTDLYKRKMGTATPASYIDHVLRDLVASHNKQHPHHAPILPRYTPLTRLELWKLSDLTYKMSIDRQLYCRALVDRIIRQEFIKLNVAKRTEFDRAASAPVVRRRSLVQLGRAHSLVCHETAWNESNVEEVLFGIQDQLILPSARDTSAQHPIDSFLLAHQNIPQFHLHLGPIRFAFRIIDENGFRKKEWEWNCAYLRACLAMAYEPSYLLAEIRLGSIMASVADSLTNSILTIDNILDKEDGCFYVGIRYDSKNITSEYVGKAKVLLGTIQLEGNQKAFQKVMTSIMKSTDDGYSLHSLVYGQYKEKLCHSMPSSPPSHSKFTFKPWLDHFLKSTCLIEIQLNPISFKLAASSQYIMEYTLATWIPCIENSIDSSELVEIHIPSHRIALSHQLTSPTLTFEALHHRFTYRNSNAGRQAIIDRLYLHLFG